MKKAILFVASLATLALSGLFVTPNDIPPGPMSSVGYTTAL